MSEQKKVISSDRFVRALSDVGIVDAHNDLIERVIIDSGLSGDVVQIYVQRYGDERLLGVIQDLDGARVVQTERPS